MKKILITTILLVAGSLSMMAQMTKVTVEVEGLACPFCAVRLEDNFLKIDGAKNVEIDMKKSLLIFEIPDAKKPSEAEIKKKVDKAGFTAGRVTFAFVEATKGENFDLLQKKKKGKQ